MEQETQAILREATAAIREQPTEEEGFGALIAAKMKNLERGQHVQCEYIIFKAISMASMGRLNENIDLGLIATPVLSALPAPSPTPAPSPAPSQDPDPSPPLPEPALAPATTMATETQPTRRQTAGKAAGKTAGKAAGKTTEKAAGKTAGKTAPKRKK